MTSQIDHLRDPIRTWLNSHQDQIAGQILALVGAPSITGFEEPAQDIVDRIMSEQAWAIDRWEASPEEIAPFILHVGDQEQWHGRPNVVAHVPGSGEGRTLMLQGHVDVADPATHHSGGTIHSASA
jgi:acetylornithine deacetylase